MSGLFSRWERRKQAVREEAEAAADPPADLSALPPVEALDAASNFSVFLQSGIPAALQTRALRVAWEQDAAIASFRGMAEYDWDFNAEGYGRLSAVDDVAALLRRVLTVEPGEPDAKPSLLAETSTSAETPEIPLGKAEATIHTLFCAEPSVLEHHDRPEDDNCLAPLRRHGGALPS